MKTLKTYKSTWKKQSSKSIYENPWFSITEDEVINPGGGISHYGKVNFKNIAIGIIPIDENNNTWLIGQYRYVPDCYSWEIPMGGGAMVTPTLDSAKRELKEETGLSANHWTELMRCHTSNSVTDESGIVYVARDLTEGETEFEESEDLQILKLPIEDAITFALNGEITDAITVASLLKLSFSLK